MNFRPTRSELLLFGGLPIGYRFLRKIGRAVEMRSAKVQNEGTINNGHFNDPQFIVMGKQFGNRASANFCYPKFLQTKVNVSFANVSSFPFVNLDRQAALLSLAFCVENNT